MEKDMYILDALCHISHVTRDKVRFDEEDEYLAFTNAKHIPVGEFSFMSTFGKKKSLQLYTKYPELHRDGENDGYFSSGPYSPEEAFWIIYKTATMGGGET